MPQLPWTEDMVVTLLNLVILKKAHLANGCKGIKEIWNDVNNAFFMQSCMEPFRALHYKMDNHRKIRDKYENVLSEVQADIERGNQSGKEGKISEKYSMVKQIKEEIDEHEYEKANNGELKRKLDANADEILKTAKVLKPMEGYGRRKLVDGTISGGSDESGSTKASASKKHLSSFDEKLLSYLEKDNDVSKQTCKEEVVEEQIKAWIKHHDKNELDVVTEGKLPDAFFEMVVYIGIDVLLSIYCSRNMNFSPVYFKEQLVLLNVGFLETHKIYVVLNQWRINATSEFEKKSKAQTNAEKSSYVTPTTY